MVIHSIATLNVLDVASYFIPNLLNRIKRQGSKYRMLCPTTHQEKTPSFFIKPKQNFFICYGCHITGGPLTLLSMLTNDPLHYLNRYLGLDVQNPEDKQLLREAYLSEQRRFGHTDSPSRLEFYLRFPDLQ